MDANDPIDYALLADLPADDPRVRALDARQRAELAAYRDFVGTPDDVAAEQLAHADAQLAAALDAAIGVAPAPAAPAPRTPVAPPRPGVLDVLRMLLAGSGLRPAYALAAVLVVAGGLYWNQARLAGPVLRGDEAAAIEVAAPVMGEAVVTFAWQAVADAERYEVRLYGGDLEETGRHDAGAGTLLSLPRARLGPGAGEVLWQVVAFRGTDEVARSRPVTLRRD
jgi:hypothetical protein